MPNTMPPTHFNQMGHHNPPLRRGRGRSNGEITMYIVKMVCSILSIHPSLRLPAAIFSSSATIIYTAYQAKTSTMGPVDVLKVIKVTQAAAVVLTILTQNNYLSVACNVAEIGFQVIASSHQIQDSGKIYLKLMSLAYTIVATVDKESTYFMRMGFICYAFASLTETNRPGRFPNYRGKSIEITNYIIRAIITGFHFVNLHRGREMTQLDFQTIPVMEN